MISDIQKKSDGTYVIKFYGVPYHADPETTPEVYQEVLDAIQSGAEVAIFKEPVIAPLPESEKVTMERQWAMAELARSDRALTPDFPVSSTDREKIMAYRTQLRNPLRSNHKDFPDPAWRPQWPEGVKRPAV